MIQGGGIPGHARIAEGFRIIKTHAGAGVPPQDAHQAGALFINHRVAGPKARGVADGAARLEENFPMIGIAGRWNLGRRVVPCAETSKAG